jgi:hypothetical protein
MVYTAPAKQQNNAITLSGTNTYTKILLSDLIFSTNVFNIVFDIFITGA